jgi:hydroxymethylpyrimidine pyrophosphatase-like HAD family hydrolase
VLASHRRRHAEEVPALPSEAVERIAGLMRHEGLHVAISSIHIHGWFGDYDKRITSCALLARHFGLDAAASPESVLFVGDSPNDASMFAAFSKSVGVANVRKYAARMTAEPKYVTHAAFGAGFVELATHLLRRGWSGSRTSVSVRWSALPPACSASEGAW